MTASSQRSRREKWKLGLSVLAADGLHRALSATYRTNFLTPSYAMRRAAGQAGRCIYVSWHEMLWHGIEALRNEGVCVLVSNHRDGELIAQVMARQGYRLARGSSTRGGAAGMRELLRVVREFDDVDLCVTADGPRGPRRELKDGVLSLAALTGLPIVPLAVAANRSWRFRSWDRLELGKPFARVAVCFGDEVRVPRQAGRGDQDGVHREQVLAAMDRAEAACRLSLGLPDSAHGC